MADLRSLITGLVAADTMLSTVFVVLYLRERQAYLRSWAFAHGADLLRQVCTLVAFSIESAGFLAILGEIAKTVGALLLLLGARQFAGRTLHPIWVLATVAASGWAVVATFTESPYWLQVLPSSLLLGSARVAAGVALYRAEGTRTARFLAGISLVLWGIHSIDYPFLRSVQWFAPWGFVLAWTFAICMGTGMLLLHLERARRQEKASAARYQELFDGAVEGFFRTSPRGRFEAANPALVRMLGYDSEAELFELDLMRDVYAFPEDRARILAHQDGDIDTVRLKRRDGSLVEVALHARRVRDAQGNVRYFEGSMRDVTEEQRLRAQLDQAQRMEALGRLAGGIAHDFNNVLGAIVAATDLARHRAARGRSADAELRDASDAAMRAADLTRQLLALARRVSLHRRPIDLRESVASTSRVLSRVLGERVEVETTLGNEKLPVLGDPGQIDQVLMNLALNARDAMPNGGRMRITLSRVHVGPNEEARLSVEDFGAGMDDQTRQHMFDPFFTTKPNGSGNGLGLAMVYGAVTQNGGRIEVDSVLGRGTRVDVYLPLLSEAVLAEAEAPRTDGARESRSLRILLVEDEPTLRQSLGAALSDAGHDVRLAANADEALALFERGPIDLLITDVVMPGRSGPDLATVVRARDPRCALIFMTGYAPEPIDDSLSAGSEILAKPFEIADLLEAVARRAAQNA